MQTLMEKLQILADSAKYDVSCSSSGVGRRKHTGTYRQRRMRRGSAIPGERTADAFHC